jgi:hypothetical protein
VKSTAIPQQNRLIDGSAFSDPYCASIPGQPGNVTFTVKVNFIIGTSATN